MKNKTVKRVASIVAIVLVIGFFSSYIIYHLVNQSNTEIKTEFALKETVYKTIDAECFVIRDEKFIRNDAVGTSVSFVIDGERVARGDTVSVVFNSSEDAASYLKAQELKKNIEGYYYDMACKTGTLWEHADTRASCNHGFSSYILCWLDKIQGGLIE